MYMCMYMYMYMYSVGQKEVNILSPLHGELEAMEL